METGRSVSESNAAVTALFTEVGLSRSLDEFGYLREAFFSYRPDDRTAKRLCLDLTKKDK